MPWGVWVYAKKELKWVAVEVKENPVNKYISH
jgi:hypothetical protein